MNRGIERNPTYFIRSSVLGGAVLTEVNNTGKKLKTYIRAAGATIAWQTVLRQTGGGTVEQIRFEHEDASGMSRKMTAANGDTILGSGEEDSMAEFDATGNSVGVDNPYPDMNTISLGEGCIGCGSDGIMSIDDNSQLMVNGARRSCLLDGSAYNCETLNSLMINGATIPKELAGFQGFRGFSYEYAGAGIFRTTLPDLYMNRNTGGVWGVPPGERADGVRIFQGGTSISSWGVQQTQKANEFRFTLISHTEVAKDILLFDRLKAIVFDAKALSDECTKAFQAIGATPIRDQLADHNVVFVTESIFMDSSADSAWSPDQELGPQVRSTANSKIRRYLGFGPVITGDIEAADITPDKEYKGKRYIFLPDYGRDEKLDHLSVTIIHAMVHSGGIPGKPGTPDLSYLGEKYDDIIKACQKNEPKVKRSASQ